MLLFEVLTNTYNWTIEEQSENFFSADFDVEDGSTYNVLISKLDAKRGFNIEFGRNEPGYAHSKHYITRTGDQFKIFATVIDIVRKFLSIPRKTPIKTISFSAEEQSRMSLYKRLVKTLLPDWTMTTDGPYIIAHQPIIHHV